MMATPAEVANDMAAQAAYWRGRDREIPRVCSDASRVLRKLLSGDEVDGRTVYGLTARLYKLELFAKVADLPVENSLARARETISQLQANFRISQNGQYRLHHNNEAKNG